MKKVLKMIGLTIVGIIALILIIVALFMNFSPQFGRGVSDQQKIEYGKTGHYKNGKFLNELPSAVEITLAGLYKFIKETNQKAPDRKPTVNIDVEKIDSTSIANHDAAITQLTWFGHSTFLLQMDGKKILIDPMFGDYPAPHPWLGRERYSKELPIEIEKLPFIDAVILSHDHYDHLDYGSIQRLKDKVGAYYTPLGVGNHLLEWGIPAQKIHELDWWDETNFKGIDLACTPARHFSGRGFLDRETTLWGSWVIKGKNESIFFSGDSGYGPHFKRIGEKYGPFDISLMECGQYNEDWKPIHMMPEETVKAAIDVKSKVVMPIHWGAFTLAMHSWTDPIERMTKAAEELNMPITTPKIGDVVTVGDTNYLNEKWWEPYMRTNDGK